MKSRKSKKDRPCGNRVRVGRYVMRDSPIEVYLDRNEDGGSVHFAWAPRAYITMNLGFDSRWTAMVRVALHEVVETALGQVRAAYRPAFSVLQREDTACYRFFMDHDQFTEAMDSCGDMLSYMLPDLKVVWQKMRRKQVK